MQEILLVALALLFVLANGFFVAAEFALVKVRATQLEGLGERMGWRARAARDAAAELDTYLSSTQLGITLASLALGWVGEPALAKLLAIPLEPIVHDNPVLLHAVAFALAFSVLTAFHIVLGELAPKSLAIRKALPTALWTAVPLKLFTRATWPLIWILNHSANFVLSLVGIPAAAGEAEMHSEEELRLLLAEQAEKGALSRGRRRILAGFLDLTRRSARQVMIPRTDVVFLSTTRPIAENLRVVRESGHTRFPLCEGDLDHTVGMVHVKDLLLRAPQEPLDDLGKIRRQILFVPESLPLERLLTEFRSKRTHMAIVVDEFGGGAGVVTLEDVLEELVGQIEDEFDLDRPEFETLPDGGCRVRGDFLLDDLAQRLRTEVGETEAETVGGYVLERLGRKPRVGDELEILGRPARVTEASEFRVRWVVLGRPVPEGRSSNMES